MSFKNDFLSTMLDLLNAATEAVTPDDTPDEEVLVKPAN